MSELVTVTDEGCVDADGCLVGSILGHHSVQCAVCQVPRRVWRGPGQHFSLENGELRTRVRAYVGWLCEREESVSLVAGVGSWGTASPDGL